MQRYIEMKLDVNFVIPKLPDYEYVQDSPEDDDDDDCQEETKEESKELLPK